MAVPAVGPRPANFPTAAPAHVKQAATEFKSLAQALQAGDLAGAQQAFAALAKDVPAVNQVIAASDAAPVNVNANSSVGSALQALSQALQAGDTGAAQKAFAALQQAVSADQHEHHQHAAFAPGNNTAQSPSTHANPNVGNNVDTTA